MAYDEGIAERLREIFSAHENVTEKKMFGGHLSQRDRDILIYCKTSGRAALATLNLKRMGYTNVRSMHGGFDAWSQLGLPVEKETTQFGD